MSSLDIIEQAAVELVDDSAQFFAPCASDLVDSLIAQYQSMHKRVTDIAALLDAETSAAVSYFLEGNHDRNRGTPSVSALFKLDGAIAALNSGYWAKTMGLTDVYDAMPQKRRDEWNKAICDMTTPNFEEDTVSNTLNDLLAQRATFFAERIDGIFRNLSSTHVTNVPEGFSKRMIVDYMLS